MRTGVLARRLAARGHEALWWTSTFDHYNRSQRFGASRRLPVEDGFEIQYLRGCGYRRNISLARLRDNRLVAAEFQRVASTERNRPDLVIASFPTAELALAGIVEARKTRTPVLLDIRDLWPDVFTDVAPGWARPVVRAGTGGMRALASRACAEATGMIGLTEEFLQWGLRHAGRERNRCDGVFPMGYDVASIPEEPLRRAREFWDSRGVRSDDGKLRAVFFGTFGRTNELAPVVEAARILESRGSPWQFVLCGRGEKEGDVKRASDSLGTVLLPGWVGANEIRALLERADVGIAPYIDSENYVGNLPNKPAEYLSGGIPIACSLDRGVLAALLSESGSGFTYGNSAHRLADALAGLERDRASLGQMKEAAAKLFASRFDTSLLYGRMIEHIEKVAGLTETVSVPD